MPVNFPLDLVSNRIGLREFRPSDLEAVLVLSYRSDPQVKQFDTFGINSEDENLSNLFDQLLGIIAIAAEV